MKSIQLALLVLFGFQKIYCQNTKPELLKQPDKWQFERFGLPPDFAPQIPFKGFEELRFSPGMFKKDTIDYFTFAFVSSLEGNKILSANDIRDYLNAYYKGLCASVAKDKKMTIDTSAVSITIGRKESNKPDDRVYVGELNMLGVFADGAPVKIHMEIKIISDPGRQRTYMIAIGSPQPRHTATWGPLYKIMNEFKVPD